MKEVLNHYKSKILTSNIINKLELIKKKFFLFSIHREENIENENNFNKISEILNKLSDQYQLPIIFSTHPRTRKKIEKMKFNPLINFIKPLSYTDYNCLQINSKVVISDSGTISEESSILNFPALNLREAHERPESMEETSVMFVGFNVERFFQALDILASQKEGNERTLKIVDDYNVDNVSEKIVRIIISYTDYVNNFIWKK